MSLMDFRYKDLGFGDSDEDFARDFEGRESDDGLRGGTSRAARGTGDFARDFGGRERDRGLREGTSVVVGVMPGLRLTVYWCLFKSRGDSVALGRRPLHSRHRCHSGSLIAA